LQNKVVGLPDLFFCHIQKLNSTEIIDKKQLPILPDKLAYGLLSQDAKQVQGAAKTFKRKRGGSKQ